MTRIRVPTNWQPILLSVESPAVIKQSWSCNAFWTPEKNNINRIMQSWLWENLRLIQNLSFCLASRHLKCECCFDGCCTYYTLCTSMLVWVSYTRWDEVFQVPLEYVTFAAVVLSLVQPVETCPYLSSIRPEKYCICCSFFHFYVCFWTYAGWICIFCSAVLFSVAAEYQSCLMFSHLQASVVALLMILSYSQCKSISICSRLR